MLWLSLYLPHLPLEAIARVLEDPEAPLVVHESQGSRRVVVARNRAAAQAGVRPGMRLPMAQALIDGLQLHARNIRAEAAALHGLAGWAGQYTSWLSVVDDAGLNLEIAGSLRLFGGVEAIRRHVEAGVDALGYRVRMAVAPTAQAAWLFARNGVTLTIDERDALREQLDAVPVGYLHQPHRQTTLAAMGIRHLGDCRRLPRAGLAQRLGADFVAELDWLYGLHPQPPEKFNAEERYRGRIVLPALLDQVDALQFPLRRLLHEMEGFLRGRGQGAMRLQLELHPEAGAPALVVLGTATPTRDPQRLLALFRERLARQPLSAPVEQLVLQATETAPMAEYSHALFHDEGVAESGIGELLECLHARLGEDVVRGLAEVADHRPERAWRYAAPGHAHPLTSSPRRPLWLLTSPRRLAQQHGRPRLDGELQLLDGPERIHSGWWDGQPVQRDYFIASTPARTRLWIFREPGPPPDWYLHGIFA